MRNTAASRESGQEKEALFHWHDLLAFFLFLLMAIFFWSSMSG
ncbi:MAG TPA: hypothetical protein PKN04_15695 [bacterium]|jgi:hypothetical protein|nr:hypothetical protein [bacterium]HNT67228.1 hypothetical protein [bacterium]HOX87762.1 hypothetical protein [bacterium]HPG47404.1 hypothetical protein [bacterium]HPM99753.1 hypothetical protein [bacterium]